MTEVYDHRRNTVNAVGLYWSPLPCFVLYIQVASWNLESRFHTCCTSWKYPHDLHVYSPTCIPVHVHCTCKTVNLNPEIWVPLVYSSEQLACPEHYIFVLRSHFCYIQEYLHMYVLTTTMP